MKRTAGGDNPGYNQSQKELEELKSYQYRYNLDHHMSKACTNVLKSFKQNKFDIDYLEKGDGDRSVKMVVMRKKNSEEIVLQSMVGVVYGYGTEYSDETLARYKLSCGPMPNNP